MPTLVRNSNSVPNPGKKFGFALYKALTAHLLYLISAAVSVSSSFILMAITSVCIHIFKELYYSGFPISNSEQGVFRLHHGACTKIVLLSQYQPHRTQPSGLLFNYAHILHRLWRQRAFGRMTTGLCGPLFEFVSARRGSSPLSGPRHALAHFFLGCIWVVSKMGAYKLGI